MDLPRPYLIFLGGEASWPLQRLGSVCAIVYRSAAWIEAQTGFIFLMADRRSAAVYVRAMNSPPGGWAVARSAYKLMAYILDGFK
jgi:hypothetical protein